MIDVLKLTSCATLMRFKPREVIISQDDKSYEHIFVVFSGTVGQFKSSTLNNDDKLNEFTKSDIFGEIEFFCGTNDSTSYIAIDDVTVVALDKVNFYTLCSTNPESTIEIISCLCDRASKTSRNLTKIKTILDSALAELGKDFESFSAQSFFPAEHKDIDAVEPEKFQEFLSPYELTCPHCSTKFIGRTQLTSKMRPINTELRADLRKKYIDFDPIWYDITSCPSCYFSAQTTFFTKPPFLSRAIYQNALEDAKSKIIMTFDYPKTLKQVFTSCYLALICADGFENTFQIKGRIWLQLSWMYEDLAQEQMLIISRKNSFNSYSQFYSVSDLDAGSSQVCHLILGYLAGRLDRYDLALDHLYRAKSQVDGKPVYKLVAERENDILREERQAKKAAEQANT